ncbi:MAG TPA: hypothetical protein VJJ76_03330 [archaeon]|nr:hypothetical protein [archaeon]
MKFEVKKCKGQITSTEFLIVSVVLVILFTFATNFWNIVAFRFGEKSFRSGLELTALDISDILINTPGTPGNWQDDTSKIFSLGISDSTHVMNEKKLIAFTNLNYTQAKKALGVPAYDYKFRIRTLNGTVIYQSGLDPSATSQIVVITRFVLLKNDIMKMEFGVWS